MSELTLYHNPRCSKSRQALALLQERNQEPKIHEYLKEGISKSALLEILGKLDIGPHALLRTKEEPYRDLGLTETSSQDEILDAICAHPVLLERPIAIGPDGARIGRPPENVLELLKS